MPREQLPLIGNVESESEPGKMWPVKAKDGKLTCSCGRWVFNKEWQANHSHPRTCHHTDEVMRQLREAGLTVTEAARQVMRGQAPLAPQPASDPITLDIRDFHLRWSALTRAVIADIEQMVRKHAGRQPAAPRTVGTRPDWLGGGRAIILRD